METIIGLYKTSPSGKVYIGESVDIYKRWRRYERLDCKGQTKLYRSLKKYGYDNHKQEIIELCEKNKLFERERYYQELFDCLEGGLNCVLTAVDGKKAVLSKETRSKISKANKGVKKSKEFCDKASARLKGIKPIEAQQAALKVRKLNNNAAYKSAEFRKKVSDNNPNKVKVIDTDTGVIYDSIAHAAKEFGLIHQTLRRYLIGTRKNKTTLKLYEQT